jgi:hypothetical protein
VVGATTLNSTLAVTNAATFGNQVTIAGLLRANGGTQTTTLTTSGNATIGGNLTVNGTSQLTGLVTASSGVNTTALAATPAPPLRHHSAWTRLAGARHHTYRRDYRLPRRQLQACRRPGVRRR